MNSFNLVIFILLSCILKKKTSLKKTLKFDKIKESLENPQDIQLWSDSQVKPIAFECWEDTTQFTFPTKAQLSTVARHIDFKNGQNKPKLH